MSLEEPIAPQQELGVVSEVPQYRDMKDYKFCDQGSIDNFNRSLPTSEALPEIIARIKDDLKKEGKALIWVTGAWGVGKTTFGKSLSQGLSNSDIETTFLDGDAHENYDVIKETVEAGSKKREVVLVAASFIERWRFRKKALSPIIINLIADDQTRHDNFYFRAGGPKSRNFSVPKAIKHRQDSPNYIISDPNCIVVDTSQSCRISPEALSEQVSKTFTK